MLNLSRILRLRLLLAAGLIAFTSLTASQVVTAQSTALNEWTWIGGLNSIGEIGNNGVVPGDSGVFGTMGVPAAGNIPGALYEASSWTDNDGNFWLFGGYGFDANGNEGVLNNLWEYTPSTNEWEWVGPSTSKWGGTFVSSDMDQNIPGWYGTLGTPGPNNFPGSRTEATTWTDINGNLWLFGGQGQGDDTNLEAGFLNDLWEFNPTTLEWTWIAGSSAVPAFGAVQPGVYGTLGTAAAGNIPGGREGATGWVDSNGNFWLFGGEGEYYRKYSDFWEFNPSTKEWAWMGGSSSPNQPGVYGTLGSPETGNVPGARINASSWTDSSGNLWLFGGDGYGASAETAWSLNDLWEFNPSLGQYGEWAWMGGSSVVGKPGVYGTLETSAVGNVPGSRSYASNWTDSSGNLWLFGGVGSDANGNGGDLNDLWEFNPSLGQYGEWAWMGGSNTMVELPGYTGYYGNPGVYSKLGTSATGNIPGGRYAAASWTDSSGNLWLFGGSGYGASMAGGAGYLNDLWVYQPSLLKPTLTVTPDSFSILPTQSLSVTVAVSGTPTPTGSVTLSGGGYSSAAATLTSGSATIIIPAGSLAVGSDTLTASYTPDANSSSTYNSATGVSSAVTVAVPKTTPTITWTAPAAIAYGTTLSATQLDATASVPGTFAYNPAAGTTPPTGTDTLSVTFTPTDTADYTTATATTSITVNQAMPTITWAAPAAIAYGTALSATQLDATASVAGSFAYNPAAGSTPPTGTDTLSVTFTPTDTTDYTTATATVQLTVTLPNPAPAISSLSPAIASASGAAFTLTVNGTGFVANSTVNWGTTALTTTYVSSTKLTAPVSAAEIAFAGTSPVTVVTPTPGGGTSNVLTFEIDSSDSTGTPPNFSVATVAVTAGSPASYAVTLPSSVTAATVSCLNLPTGANCSYSAGTVTITTSTTTPKGTYQIIVVFTETVTESASAWILLPILLLPLYFARKRLTRHGAWLSACVVLVLLTATATIVGCGGGGSSTTNQQPPPPQTYQVVSSGTVMLTVQ
jgi:N-acetylneuraminic acid mutarotase